MTWGGGMQEAVDISYMHAVIYLLLCLEQTLGTAYT